MIYNTPTSYDEYWFTVDAYWDQLYAILVKFLPTEKLEHADAYRLNKDSEILSLFNDAWFNAPDNRSIHSIPGWHILCDLCSESYLLEVELEK